MVVEDILDSPVRMGMRIKSEQDGLSIAQLLHQPDEEPFPQWEQQFDPFPPFTNLEDFGMDEINSFYLDHEELPENINEAPALVQQVEATSKRPDHYSETNTEIAALEVTQLASSKTLEPCKIESPLVLSKQKTASICPPVHATRPRVQSKPPKRWTHEEEIHFIGSVFLVFTEKGSLFPAKRKGRGAGGYTRQCESDTFERVNELFERSKAISGPSNFEPRTSKALCRHLKQMKQRYITPNNFGGKRQTGFLPLIYEWLALCGNTMFTCPKHVEFPYCENKRTWELEEEILLIGAAFERFFSRGSLCTNTRAKGAVHCWREVMYLYDLAWARLGMVKPRERSMTELSNHYKKIKKKTVHADGPCDLKPYIQAYLRLEKGNRMDYTIGRP